MTKPASGALIDKIRNLSPERAAEVEDFVDFLTSRDQERTITQAAARLSEGAFHAVWDNEDDGEYDRCRFADVVLVPFPFTDQTTSKKRPAVVVSSNAYHQNCPDVIVMAVTSQLRRSGTPGELVIYEWQAAGLLKPSVVKPVVATLDRRLVLKRLGSLKTADAEALRAAISQMLG